MKLVGGRYMTPVGAESFFANENFNVTRGLLWTLQPVNHTGGYSSAETVRGAGSTWQLGASNRLRQHDGRYGHPQPTFVGSVGYKVDTLGMRVNGVYGGNIDDLVSGLGSFGLVGVGANNGLTNNGNLGSPGVRVSRAETVATATRSGSSTRC